MSKISQDFINDLGSLYENIHIKDQDFLNEESEYYEEETAELAEDIVLSLALTMFSEGYTAETFIKFLANSNEEDILEKYLTTDVTFISEETIHNDFVEEQLELLEVAGLIKLLGRGVKAAASGIKAGAKATKGAVKKGVTKAAEAGVERRVGKQFVKSTDPSRTTAAVEKIAKNKATKAGITVPQGALTPKQSTELLKQARTARAIQGLKSGAKMALAGGLGVLGGYMGAKMGSGDKGGIQGGGRPEASSPSQETPSGGSGGGGGTVMRDPVRPSTGSGGTSTPASKKPSAPAPKKPEEGPKGETPMQKWARLHPTLAAKVKPGQSGYEEISAKRDKPGPNEKQDQTPTIGKPEAKIDTKAVEADLKKEQERLKKKAAETASTTKEAYDIVLEYLIGTEQVESLTEAHYVMMEMDVETIGSIVEDYEYCLLVNEVSEWVDGLVEEGYDLSEYTWDDIIKYYVTEAKIDDDKTDDEKRTARIERGTIGHMHPFTRKTKKKRGQKTLSSTGKYSQMLHDKKQAQRERDADEQRGRDRDAMSRGTWDND
jgi:hypothetical protein